MTDRRFAIGETALRELLDAALAANAHHTCIVGPLYGPMQSEPAVLLAYASKVADAVLASLSERPATPEDAMLLDLAARLAYVVGTDTPDTERAARAALVTRVGALETALSESAQEAQAEAETIAAEELKMVEAAWDAGYQCGSTSPSQIVIERAKDATGIMLRFGAERGSTPVPAPNDAALMDLLEQARSSMAAHSCHYSNGPEAQARYRQHRDAVGAVIERMTITGENDSTTSARQRLQKLAGEIVNFLMRSPSAEWQNGIFEILQRAGFDAFREGVILADQSVVAQLAVAIAHVVDPDPTTGQIAPAPQPSEVEDPWPHPCRTCGGYGGHESGCPGDVTSAAAEVERSAQRVVQSIATMLGWENVPSQYVLEAEIRALKARAQTSPPAPVGCSNGAHVFFQPEKHPVCKCGAWKMRDVAGMPVDGVSSEPEPAPSGWQQRIAAMTPWDGYDMCLFCQVQHYEPMRDGGGRSAHKPDCLWQNAKDAHPPSSGWSAEDERKAVITYILSCREERDIVQVFDVMASHIRDGKHVPDARPPAPEASPAKAER